jgi:hypothetical protein
VKPQTSSLEKGLIANKVSVKTQKAPKLVQRSETTERRRKKISYLRFLANFDMIRQRIKFTAVRAMTLL